jgi:hypothetical protein
MNEIVKANNEYSRKAEIALAKKPVKWHGISECNTVQDVIRHANENGLGVAACVQLWARLSGASTAESTKYKNDVCKSYALKFKDNFIARFGNMLNTGFIVDKESKSTSGNVVKIELRKIVERGSGRKKLDADAIKTRAQNELIEKMLAAGIITEEQALAMTK